jgi:DNA-binding CsgD family transcriptional regulator
MGTVVRGNMKHLTMGQVAQRAGMGVETVRFYKRDGLTRERPGRGDDQ